MLSLLKGLFTLFFILLLTMSALFVDFVYKTFSVQQRDMKVDAVVVLAGGKGRVDEGLKLYREGKGEKLFLIGVDPLVRKKDLVKEQPGNRSVDNIILENASRNTLENAVFARETLIRHNVRSMLLITSRYHMKRSMLIFRNVFPKDMAIYPYPVTVRKNGEEWWSHGGSLKLLFSEFYKYCLYRIIFIFSPGELRQ